MKVKVYIAGPYTNVDVGTNVHNAMIAFDRLMDAGLVPFCPHWAHYQHIMSPRVYDEWLEYTMEWISICNCIVRLPGDSEGADREVELAKIMGLRVYHHIHDCIAAETIPMITHYDTEGGCGP
jgi:hypothetical protein